MGKGFNVSSIKRNSFPKAVDSFKVFLRVALWALAIR